MHLPLTIIIFNVIIVKTNGKGQNTSVKVFSPPPKRTDIGENRPFKAGRSRKLCRKKSRSWKSWFEGKADKEQCFALLPLGTFIDPVDKISQV